MSVSTTTAAPARTGRDDLQGILGGAPWPEPERAVQHIRLDDRLEHDLQRGLHDPVRHRRDRQRPLLRRRAGLGNPHPARRKRSVAAALQHHGKLVEQPVNPYSSTWAMVTWSMPGAPRLRRTCAHARCKTSLRESLSYSAWNRRPGSALAARYSACCKARTASRSSGFSTPTGVGLATTGTHRPSLPACAQTKQRPFPSPAVVLSVRLDRYYGRLRRPAGWPSPSRSPGYRTPRSGACPQPPGQRGPPQVPPSPSKRSAPSPPGVLGGCTSRVFTASMAFALRDGARLPLVPHTRAHSRRGRLRFDAADRLVAPPSQGL